MMDLSPIRMLRLPQDEFLVFGSAVMEIRGIRKANDIDVIVSERVWNELKREYPKGPDGQIVNGAIEIWPSIPGVDFKDALAEADEFDGMKFTSLRMLAAWKKSMGREKDIEDVQLIEEYLAKQ